MNIYIPSYNRADSHTTYHVLGKMGLKSKVVVHTLEQKSDYVASRMPEEDCLCLGAPPGLAANRKAIMDYARERGETWHIQMSDDALEFTKVAEPYYQQDRIEIPEENPRSVEKHFKVPMTGEEMLSVFSESVARAEEEGAYLVGFAVQDNYYFRSKKWKSTGLVDGRCWILHESNVFDPNCDCRDDVSQTAINLLEHGRVCINNFMLPDFKRYTVGGLGTPKERYEKRKEECEYLMKKYPGLFRVKHEPEKFRIDVSFIRNSRKALENWRGAMQVLQRQKVKT